MDLAEDCAGGRGVAQRRIEVSVCRAAFALAVVLSGPAALHGQMPLQDYAPKSTLRVPVHSRPRAKFPAIDVHSHHYTASRESWRDVVAAMDSLNLGGLVNLSGGSGENLARMVEDIAAVAPGRIAVFANLDFSGLDEPGWGERAAAQLEADYRHGARGLKIYKNFGMDVYDARGRVPTDDPRIDPVWAKAGQLGIPVLIHTGEPAPFFEPADEHNERWLELQLTGRARPSEPSWETLMQEQWRLFRKHPGTKFISAHLSWLGNDLDRLGALLDSIPNMYTEMAAVGYELGRQPRHARAFLIKYQDRVMMGKDTWAPSEFSTYFRILETEDEYFDWYRKYHAHWKMYGLGLPDDVLKKIYYKNALHVIPGLDASRFPD